VSKKYLETIKANDGVIYHIEFHQLRLDTALNAKGIHNLHILLSPPSSGLYRCRVVYDKQNIQINYFSYVKRSVKSLKILIDDDIKYEHKYENREKIDSLFEKREECDDILIVKNGLITDTSIANIAFFDGVDWISPKKPLLKGTTRARLLKERKLILKDIRKDDLKAFTKAALMNAMIDFDIIAEDKIEELIC
jgi:4-amino-4-deoxychorismate lyase